jgi:hypothetical protein
MVSVILNIYFCIDARVNFAVYDRHEDFQYDEFYIKFINIHTYRIILYFCTS